KVRPPQSAKPRLPQSPSVMARRNPYQLLVGVGHVERLVLQDFVEYRLCGSIRFQDFLVDAEAAGRGFFRKVQERQQGILGAGFDPQLIQPTFAGREPIGFEPRSGGSLPSSGAQSQAAVAKQPSVSKLIERVP